MEASMMKEIILTLTALMVFMPMQAKAFCGFYVAKADADLFNEASTVVMSREAA